MASNSGHHAMPPGSLRAAPEELTAMFDAAEEFLATTSIFRQRRESREAFEKLALAVLTVRMMNAGQELGEIVTGDDEQCVARRVHPLSSEYYIRCQRESGHDGPHQNAQLDWDDGAAAVLPEISPNAVEARRG